MSDRKPRRGGGDRLVDVFVGMSRALAGLIGLFLVLSGLGVVGDDFYGDWLAFNLIAAFFGVCLIVFAVKPDW